MLTFITGAALASVAGLIFLPNYGVIDFFIGFLAGMKAFAAVLPPGLVFISMRLAANENRRR